ncbi:MAG: hypothetical protein AAF602_16840, partial [Myxococcota bacterium]
MSTRQFWLDHRGAITAMVALPDQHIVFVTEHPEGQATGVYRLDPLHGTLEHQAMPGGRAVVTADSTTLWVAARDGGLWSGRFGALQRVGDLVEPVPTGLAPAGDDLAMIAGDALVI